MKREQPINRLPWQVQAEIAQAEGLMSSTPWAKAVMAGGRMFLSCG